MGHTAVYCHAWGTLLYITMHGAHCCILPCMGHTAVYCHAWGTLLYTAMHGAHCCILPCMGHTAVYYHTWGTLLYIAMHGAHCCILSCIGHMTTLLPHCYILPCWNTSPQRWHTAYHYTQPLPIACCHATPDSTGCCKKNGVGISSMRKSISPCNHTQ